MHELSMIPNQVQEVADAIASLLNINVDIIDYRLIRVAASGYYSHRIGYPMRYGTISRHVLKTKELYCVTTPANDPVCKACPGYTGKNNCLHNACISAPIVFNNDAIGTINLLSWTSDQTSYIQEKKLELSSFLRKMSDIIISELKKEEAMERNNHLIAEMSVILNTVHSGIILTDHHCNILNMNPSAYRILRLDSSTPLDGNNITTLLPDLSIDILSAQHEKRKLHVTANQKLTSAELVADIAPIYQDGTYIGSVISFDRLSEYVHLASAMISHQRNISFNAIVGHSPQISEAKAKAQRFASSNSTILILGESGTGKELFARAIHNASNRSSAAFVTVNCGALPDSLIESELFGYVKGAFTGASPNGKIGMFELANHGTLFLDEIGTMPIYLQAKLLRVLQEREITRIGAVRSVPIDVRIIAATNADLSAMVDRGQFRQDLFYRIAVLPIVVPPLRERTGDILPLTEYFIHKYRVLLQKPHMEYSADFVSALLSHNFPGNVRELQNAIEYAVNVIPDGETLLTKHSLPTHFLENSVTCTTDIPLAPKEYKHQMIHALLKKYGDSASAKKRIAKELDIGLSTLYRILKEDAGLPTAKEWNIAGNK